MSSTEHMALWGVRDSNGVLHLAQVNRFFDQDNELVKIVMSTGCCPSPSYWARALGDHAWYHGARLPQVALKNGTLIVEWHVNEAPTCVACAAAPREL